MNHGTELPAEMLLGTKGEEARARAIARHGSLAQAMAAGALPRQLSVTLSEALLLIAQRPMDAPG